MADEQEQEQFSRWASAIVFSASDGSLATTGHKVWPGALHLAHFLLGSARGASFLATPSLRVLELGAGTGWLGLTVALNKRDIGEVLLTERDEGVSFLERNIASFSRETGIACASARSLDWARGCGGIASRSWDLVVGSDLLYEEDSVRLLVGVWKQLLLGSGSDAPQVLYCHTFGRYETIDELFFEELERQGLLVSAIEEVEDGDSAMVSEAEDDAEDDAERDMSPPYADLFPTMRQVVLCIELPKERST